MDGDGTSVSQPQAKGIRGLKELPVLEELHVVLLLEREIDKRTLGEALDAEREHLDILPKRMVSQRSTFHLNCQYFLTPLSCTPYAFVVLCLK